MNRIPPNANVRLDPRTPAPDYGGVVAVVPTPCRGQGQVDAPAVERLGRELGNAGCHGIFVLGSTGELTLLDDADRQTLIAAARRGASNRTMLYAGISGHGPKHAIRLAHMAAEEGADAAVLMAPWMLDYGQEELVHYVLTVADASRIPVVLYHHRRMPTAFDIATVARLAEHPKVVGIKDSGVDAGRFAELAELGRRQSFAVMQGCENMMLQGLEQGAAGVVAALACLVPEWLCALFRAHGAGDRPTAAGEQEKIDRLLNALLIERNQESFSYFGHALKCGLKYRGWLDCFDSVMPGFCPDPAVEPAVRRLLAQMGVPPAGEDASGPHLTPRRRPSHAESAE